jgi:hypothetical protein
VVAEATAACRALAERNTTAYALTKTNVRGAMIESCLADVVADMDRMSVPKV